MREVYWKGARAKRGCSNWDFDNASTIFCDICSLYFFNNCL